MSNFDHAAPLVEFLLLVNIATHFGQMLEFEPLACKVTNHLEADALRRREYRQGWILQSIDWSTAPQVLPLYVDAIQFTTGDLDALTAPR